MCLCLCVLNHVVSSRLSCVLVCNVCFCLCFDACLCVGVFGLVECVRLGFVKIVF